MSKMKEQQVTIMQAAQELTIQGFKPMVSGFDIELWVWNEERSSAYKLQMSPPHIEWLASKYSKRLTDANQAMRTQYKIND